ncbi:hypothetical protein [Nocardia cyriacigeorgica]|uniref:hypothetical protein n=1 Tax=Nocardia cyriacigeorgica TaxID=135487 RepID=UPI0011D18BC1|nr:hypothetical protein [Nocardia cyriacigeorgica]
MRAIVIYSAALGTLLGAVFAGAFWWLIVGGAGTATLSCAAIDPEMTETINVAFAYEPWTVSVGLVLIGTLVGAVVGLLTRVFTARSRTDFSRSD